MSDPVLAPPATDHDIEGAAAVLRATRDLLWMSSPKDAKAVACRLVRELGGTTVSPDDADSHTLPVDVSFGVGTPMLPTAEGAEVAQMLLARQLPLFVRDAQRALELAARTDRLAEEANVDVLTGLTTRRAFGRAIGRLQPADVVVLLDLDHFKQLNDTHGHGEGDRALHVFGRTLARGIRVRDVASRYGGEEFTLVLTGAPSDQDVEALLDRLRATWEQARPHPITFSAGIARAEHAEQDVLAEADRAMYVSKEAGRDRWTWADRPHRTASAEPDSQPAEPLATGAFVAWSHVVVPPEGRESLVDAFQQRLRMVDDWPGFQRLQVWEDTKDATSFVMVSWWDDEGAFASYMGSPQHRQSHARIPDGPDRPHAAGFNRYRVVAR